MAERMTWSDDDLIDGRLRSGASGTPGNAGARRVPLVAMLIGGIVAAALVGSGVTWLLIGSSGRSVQSSAPPLIKADEKPIKVYPESPGGMTAENADKLVYSRLRGETGKGDVERLLPEPERPQRPTPAEVAAPPPESSPIESSSPTSTASDLPSGRATHAPSAPVSLGADPGYDEDEPALPPVVTAPTPPAPAPKAVDSKPVQVAAAKPLPAKPVTKPADQPVTAPAPASGKFQLQLLAARSSEDATAAWKKIQAKNGDVLGGLNGSVARADLGDRGVFYRLRVGPIASEAQARSICSTLAGRSVSCLIIRPGR